MARYSEHETVEEWHVRVRCSVEEIPHVAASIPKVVAGITRCYQADIVHVHQLPAPQPQALPRYDTASFTRNGSRAKEHSHG